MKLANICISVVSVPFKNYSKARSNTHGILVQQHISDSAVMNKVSEHPHAFPINELYTLRNNIMVKILKGLYVTISSN